MTLHAISYDWQGFKPCLYVYDRTTEETREFDFRQVNYKVSHPVTCVGSWSEDGYVPCQNREIVKGGNVCDECASSFLPDLDCMFEPRCDGEECGMKFCGQEHTVYIAFHGFITKVGLTSTKRLEQRMVEQGADAYAAVTEVKGRRSARMMEVAIADQLVIRQRVRGIESLAAMREPCLDDDIRDDHAKLAERLGTYGHRLSGLRFLRDYPIELPLKSMPTSVKPGGQHKGKSVGVKGKFLVYENGGLKALNMQYLVGRHIRASEAGP
jgi:hypothetical protein